MNDFITLEDINTLLLKFSNWAYYFEIDTTNLVDTDEYSVVRETIYLNDYIQFNFYLKAVLSIDYDGRIYEYSDVNQVPLYKHDNRIIKICGIADIGQIAPATPFGPITPINRPFLKTDELYDKKLYIWTFDDLVTPLKINEEDILQDDEGYYVPYSVLLGECATLRRTLSFKVIKPTGGEDWLKNRYHVKLNLLPKIPHIEIINPVYKGNNNQISDIIQLPSENIEYNIYYQGKDVTESLELPIDYAKDSVDLRIVTKSYEPYIGMDIFMTVPVETKELNSIEDLNNYSYGFISEISDLTGELNNPIVICANSNSIIENCKLTINNEVIFKSEGDNRYIRFIGTKLINNASLTLSGVYISNNETKNKEYDIINNENLIIKSSEIYKTGILNNNRLELENSQINPTEFKEPFIYSSTDDYSLIGNYFDYNVAPEVSEDVCVIRCSDFNAEKFLIENNTDYDCDVEFDNKYIHFYGNGVAWLNINENVIHTINLTVNEDD